MFWFYHSSLALYYPVLLAPAQLFHSFLSYLSVVLNDGLFSFDLSTVTMAWMPLSTAVESELPSARAGHGFISEGGKLYMHGGGQAFLSQLFSVLTSRSAMAVVLAKLCA